MQSRVRVDVLIFGGGAAGLWLLDELVRRGRSVLLLESHALGSGQTIASQGIIHGGLKYTLSGMLTESAAAIRDMPLVWRDCLAGRREPNLAHTTVRANACYLWRTDSVRSRLGMIGARVGLRVAPEAVSVYDRPAALAACPGTVARLPEQVISPASFLCELAARHRSRILKIDTHRGLEFDLASAGHMWAVRLRDANAASNLMIEPSRVVLTAGAGNALLRERVGLSAQAMQRRPLHMVILRGDLPELSGHCVDGARTRVTITSDRDRNGTTVWQVGGQIAEDGVSLDAAALSRRAQAELIDVLPGLDLHGVEIGAYRVDRAEGATAGGKRPESIQILEEGNVLTAWPTKLAFAPLLAEALAEKLDQVNPVAGADLSVTENWERPTVALPPWETCTNWMRVDRAADQPAKRRRAA